MKGCHIISWEWKWSTCRGLDWRIQLTWNYDVESWSALQNCYFADSKWYSAVCLALSALYACLKLLAHAANEKTDGVLKGPPPRPGPGRGWAPGQSEVQPCSISWTEKLCPRVCLLDLGQVIMPAAVTLTPAKCKTSKKKKSRKIRREKISVHL